MSKWYADSDLSTSESCEKECKFIKGRGKKSTAPLFPNEEMVTLPSAVSRFAGKQEKGDRLKFSFDRVFPMETMQEAIYRFTGADIVQGVLEGFNGTIFAYGQTGSGKSFTMTGPSIEDEQMKGIIPRIVSAVF